MQSESARIRECMRENGWSQAQLAARARVHQSTVSRALAGRAARHSQARHRLAILVEQGKRAGHVFAEDVPERVIKAFDRIWDGTDAHAAKIAEIISALAGLRPVVTTKKRGRVEKRQSTQKAPKRRRPK
jgi:transcriptional regulator with XRE-family HTH domain